MAGLFADNPGAWYGTALLDRVYTIVAENGTILLGAYGRNGASAVRFSGDVDDTIAPQLLVTPSGATGIVEIDLRVSAAPAADTPILQFLQGGSVQCSLYFNTDRTFAAFRGSGGALTQLGSDSTYALPLNQHTRLQFKLVINGSTGTFTVRKWGPGDTLPVDVLTLTGLDTLETGSATWDELQISAACAGDTDVSNIVIKDGSGSRNNDLADAPQNVVDRRPNADGANSDFVPSSGLFQHAGVDDVASDDDVTFNDGEAVNDLDTLAMQDLVDADHDIDFVVLALVARGAGASETLAHVVRQGATDTASASANLAAAYDAFLRPYDTLPDTTPWTPAEWSAVELGYKRTA